ncbi:MAG: glycosyltransferase family 4 protein [Thermodesulfobacteriota bacterium]
MKIAQVAPLFESVPPKLYGGTERIVSYITEGLINKGHNVTLFASADSETEAELISPVKSSLRLNDKCMDRYAPHFQMLEMVSKEAYKFDLIHFHIDYLHFPVSRRENFFHLTTLHGRLDIPELKHLYNEYSDMTVVSISYSQRNPLPQANWVGNVYHGIDADLYDLNENRGRYLAFLGRISPEKRVDRAIEIALGSGLPLKIAAKVDNADLAYFESKIKPLLNNPSVEFIGEINEEEKNYFLGNAMALLFPIDWPEPFGLVMIEAMACGTPVIAYPNGSVNEVLDHGITGFIVNDIKEGIEAVYQSLTLSRKRVRKVFEQRFTVENMVNNYLDIYENMIKKQIMDVA